VRVVNALTDDTLPGSDAWLILTFEAHRARLRHDVPWQVIGNIVCIRLSRGAIGYACVDPKLGRNATVVEWAQTGASRYQRRS